MSKKDSNAVMEITAPVSEPTDNADNAQPKKTHKKYINKADKLVRRLDNVISDLDSIYRDAVDLLNHDSFNPDIATDEVKEKDYDRVSEISEVVNGINTCLYYLANRMARKYSNKSIAPLQGAKKRESLKLR